MGMCIASYPIAMRHALVSYTICSEWVARADSLSCFPVMKTWSSEVQWITLICLKKDREKVSKNIIIYLLSSRGHPTEQNTWIFHVSVNMYTVKIWNSLLADECKNIAEVTNGFISLFWNGISTQSDSMKQYGPNSTSRLGNSPVSCFFPKHLLLDTTEKKQQDKTNLCFDPVLVSSYFICCALLNNHLVESVSGTAELIYFILLRGCWQNGCLLIN